MRRIFRRFNIRKIILPLLCVTFILALILYSKASVKAAASGINLWLNIVFPSLFPFFVVSQLLNKTGFVEAAGKLLEPIMRPLFNVPGSGSFALAMGITSGYPIGAKITASLREEGVITKTEAERLLTFTNNSGPLFIIGAVSVGMFNFQKLGPFLLACHIAASLTVGFLFRYYKRWKSPSKNIILSKATNHNSEITLAIKMLSFRRIGNIFGEAIRDSIFTMLAIGGFIVFFSVLISLLLVTGIIGYMSDFLYLFFSPMGIKKDIITSILSGFFEITSGTSMASKAAGSSLYQKLTTVSIIIGWAGLSVHSQVLSIIANTDISIKPYLIGKMLQGLISGIYTFLGLKIAGSSILGTTPAFYQPDYYSNLSFYNSLSMSLRILLMILTGLIILGLASKLKTCFSK